MTDLKEGNCLSIEPLPPLQASTDLGQKLSGAESAAETILVQEEQSLVPHGVFLIPREKALFGRACHNQHIHGKVSPRQAMIQYDDTYHVWTKSARQRALGFQPSASEVAAGRRTMLINPAGMARAVRAWCAVDDKVADQEAHIPSATYSTGAAAPGCMHRPSAHLASGKARLGCADGARAAIRLASIEPLNDLLGLPFSHILVSPDSSMYIISNI
jgi:hypothetical protein